MSPAEFVDAIAAVHLENVFNPYSDRCPVYDRVDAPRVRRRALLALLMAATQTEVDAVWIGRDLGYLGGRRTGFALTDDAHLEIHSRRWNISTSRSTTGPAMKERTAAVIWEVLAPIARPIVLWNVFPLHPHQINRPLTNRAHTALERAVGSLLLRELLTMVRPRVLVAIGNDAATVAQNLANGSAFVKVRHPSYGGRREFIRQIGVVYGPVSRDRRQELPDDRRRDLAGLVGYGPAPFPAARKL